MYKYETHLHTSPVSRCASATVRETLEFYHALGYDGVFITNHFLDGSINIARDKSYAERLAFYLSDYYEALRLSPEIGIKVFFGVETSYKGTDFLVYGLPPQWYEAHPEIMDMKKSEELAFIRAEGGYVSHAHPFREARYIDHLRLYPRHVDAVETINACRTDFANERAEEYARAYELQRTAGSDNHKAAGAAKLAGMSSEVPLMSEDDFVKALREGSLEIFVADNPLLTE